MGILLMKILIAEYMVILLAFLWAGDYWRAFYWLCAAGLNYAVLNIH